MTVWYLPSANIILFIIETAFMFGILREKPLQCVSGEAEPGNDLEKLLHTYKNIKLPPNMGILE